MTVWVIARREQTWELDQKMASKNMDIWDKIKKLNIWEATICGKKVHSHSDRSVLIIFYSYVLSSYVFSSRTLIKGIT